MIELELVEATETVTPLFPDTDAPDRFVPVMVRAPAVPRVPLLGLISVIVGRFAAVTVKLKSA